MFKDIKNYEGLYQINTDGVIIKNDRTYHCGADMKLKRFIPGGIVKHSKNEKGYHCVKLSKNGKSKKYKVHRLVAETFIPNVNNLDEVNHIDENKDNNSVSNLEWCSHNDNIAHSINSGTIPVKPVCQYDIDGNFLAEYSSITEASRKTGIHRGHIRNVSNGSYGFKSAGGYIWRYKNG